MTDPTTQRLEPVAIPAHAGEARWWLGNLAVIKATAEDTGGLMTIVEVSHPPGAMAPLHVHYREDEAFWILEGDATLQVGEATIHVAAGDYAFGPRNVPHSYQVGDGGCRMLFICTPGGFEALVRDQSEPAAERVVPAPSGEAPDFEFIARVARAHGCELLV